MVHISYQNNLWHRGYGHNLGKPPTWFKLYQVHLDMSGIGTHNYYDIKYDMKIVDCR